MGSDRTSMKGKKMCDSLCFKIKTNIELFPSIVIVLLAAGCAYQVWTFYELYITYPLTVDVQLHYKGEMEVPSLTICNNNGIKRTRYCKKFPEKCYAVGNITEFCQQYPSYCMYGDNGNKLLMPDLSNMERGVDHSFYTKFAHGNDMLLYRKVYARNSQELKKPGQEIPNFNVKGDNVQSCLILNSQAADDYSSVAKPLLDVEVEPFSPMSMIVDFEPEEYVDPNSDVNGLLVVQSPLAILNPSTAGIMIRPSYRYNVNLKPIEKYLLPAPYRTNCSDAGENPSWEICVLKCTVQEMMRLCGCVEKEVFYPHNYPICWSVPECNTRKYIKKPCHDNCQQACYSLDYEVSIEEMEHYDFPLYAVKNKLKHLRDRRELIKKRAAVITIYIPRPEIMVYRYNPKFEGIELFSYLGGYIGIWLGISLATVYEFFTKGVTLILKSYAARRKATKVIAIPVTSKIKTIF